MSKEKLKHIPVEAIDFGTRRREDYGNMESLIESVKLHGIIQPITVREDGDRFFLKAGGRRTTAAIAAGLKTIPALLRTMADYELDDKEVELIENSFRKDLNWVERAALIKDLMECYSARQRDWSQSKLAQLLDRSPMEVSRSMTVARALEVLPELAKLAKTQDEALKVIKKLEEGAIVQELRSRQRTAMSRGTAYALEVADSNYRIGDTLEGLAELRTNGVIHIIECDPPYAIDLTEQKSSESDITKSYREITREAYPDFLRDLCSSLYRVAGPHCWLLFWFGPTWFTLVKQCLTNAGWAVDDIPAIWYRVGSPGQTLQPQVNLARSYEPFFVCRKGQPAIIKAGRSNVFAFQQDPDKWHTTQRPLKMMEEIISTFSLPGNVVLVPFLGSGVSLRASYSLGLSCFGWDADPQYKDRFMIAVEQDVKDMDTEAVEGI